MSGFFQWHDNDLLLKVQVKPKSSFNKLEPGPDRLKVKITAVPVDGKANKHLIKYLAGIFLVAPSNISIEKGAHQSLKTLRIRGPGTLPAFISRMSENDC